MMLIGAYESGLFGRISEGLDILKAYGTEEDNSALPAL
jgi:hypothetical protein